MTEKCKRCLLRDSMPADYEKYVASLLRAMAESQRAQEAVYRARLESCRACDQLSMGTCMGCGCLVELKAAYKKEKCPFGRWIPSQR